MAVAVLDCQGDTHEASAEWLGSQRHVKGRGRATFDGRCGGRCDDDTNRVVVADREGKTTCNQHCLRQVSVLVVGATDIMQDGAVLLVLVQIVVHCSHVDRLGCCPI